MSTLFEYLLWVDPFWGRCNMGAIEFSKPLFILVDFRALSAIIRKYMHISYWDLNDYCRVTPYRGENLSLLLHTSETRSLPRVATKRSTANSTQNTDDWQKQLQSTEITTHATHAPHVTHATHATRATHAFFAIFAIAKTRSLKKKCNTHIRRRPFLAQFRENFYSLKITN